jgi:NADH-quinone oxidoreductase subunit H
MISYEVAMGLSLIPILLLVGNVSFTSIIDAQQQAFWFIGPLFLSFFVFLIAGFAETNRLPFDMPEAESELIAGYHTEYSAMKFSMFFIAEYANIITISAMVATLFFGGWDVPFTDWDESGSLLAMLAGFAMFFVKTFFWIFFVMWIRWTLPRFRYDQLMALGWKFLMPMALTYIMVIAIASYVIERVFGQTDPWILWGGLTVLNVLLAGIVFLLLDRGAVVSGTGAHVRTTSVGRPERVRVTS